MICWIKARAATGSSPPVLARCSHTRVVTTGDVAQVRKLSRAPGRLGQPQVQPQQVRQHLDQHRVGDRGERVRDRVSPAVGRGDVQRDGSDDEAVGDQQ